MNEAPLKTTAKHTSVPPAPFSSWEEYLTGIVQRDECAMEALWKSFSAFRYMVYGKAGIDAEDILSEAFLKVIKMAHTIKEPAALMGFVRTIIWRQYCDYVGEIMRHKNECAFDDLSFSPKDIVYLNDPKTNPLRILLESEEWEYLQRGLKTLRPSEREILERFYLDDQKEPEIRKAMKLTDTQFRLNKSRSKTKLTSIVSSMYKGKKKIPATPVKLESMSMAA